MRHAPARLLLASLLIIATACADDPVRDVARAVASSRTLPARLTIPLGAPGCIARALDTTPCVATPSRLTSTELRAARRAEQRLRTHPDAAAWHAAGLADLLWGDSAGNALDRSITRLQTAARLADSAAPVLADLSAAYLARAERSRDPRDLLESMEAASRALDLSPDDPVARTDLALALDRVGAVERAARAWGDVAAIETDPRWKDAAAHRRRSLAARLARGDSALVPRALPVTDAALVALADSLPQEARTVGWTVLLRAWGDSELAGNESSAERALARAERTGAALAARGRDCTLIDAVRAIRAHADDRVATARLARAHAAFARGSLRLDALDHEGAAAELRAALDQRAPSPMLNAWATLLSGIADGYARRLERAEPVLREVAESADSATHPALAARAHWAHGIVLLRLGRHTDEGIAELRTAERLYARAGEREYLGVVRSHLAEALLTYGQAAEGWNTLNAALRTLADFPYARSRHAALYDAVHFAARDGYVGAARLLQEESDALARRRGDAVEVLEALLTSARLQSTRGDVQAAVRTLDSAQAIVRQLPSRDMRAWFEADVALSRAVAVLDREPSAAAAALDSAERYFGSDSVSAPRWLAALFGRAQAALRLHDDATAERTLGNALALLDAQRDSIVDRTVRAALLESARATIEAMVVRQASGGHPDRALAWLERGRSSLVARGGRGAGAARRGASTSRMEQARARPGTIVVDYALIGDTLHAWTVADGGVRLATMPVKRDALARTIERARSAMELGFAGPELREALVSLHRSLIRPIAQRLGADGTELVIVADGAVGNVPFAALLDEAHGDYLVERHPLRFAASLADAVLPPLPLPDAHGRGPLVLVGEPALAPGTSEGGVQLVPLHGAGAEVRAIAAQARDRANVSLLDGAHASPPALRDAFARASVLHYAGHAVLDDAHAERSWLALAPDSKGTSRLTAEELATLDLSHLELVVLSACQTLRARDGSAGGFAGFAEALLSAGAGGVVGSLWRVEDESTRGLMVDFHRARQQQPDVARALQAVQVRWLRSPDARRRSPAAWGAFRYAGR